MLRSREKIYVPSPIAEGRKNGYELQKLGRTEGRRKFKIFQKFPKIAIVL
jgi:hypothetical protein